MTPRAGVKTTPAIETRLLGPPIPSGGPFYFSLTLYLYLRAFYLLNLYIQLN